MSYFNAEESSFGIGFFERLETDDDSMSVYNAPDALDVLDSIKRNVAHLLNTREGESQSAPELGLIDFNDASLSTMDLAVRIKIAINKCLALYEPRLKNISVQSISEPNDPLGLYFQLVAEINSDALHKKVNINLMLGSNRKYRVY